MKAVEKAPYPEAAPHLAGPEQYAAPDPDEYLVPAESAPDTQAVEELARVRARLAEERVLEAGGLVVKPIEGNPFVLSEGRENEVVPGAVTTFHKDGSTTVRSYEEDARVRAQEREAARYFSNAGRDVSPDAKHSHGPSLVRRIGRAVTQKLKTWWVNLWK